MPARNAVVVLLALVLLALPAGASARPIAAGEAQSCAITPAGGAVCWGSRSSGSLGDGLTTPYSHDPVGVVGLRAGVTDIAHTLSGGGSSSYGCAVVSGALKCWGEGDSGKLGNGTTTSSTTPVNVVGLGAGVTDVSVHATHACAIQSGAAKCWGSGTLGNGTNDSSSVPVQVSGLTSGVTAIATGWRHACALQGGAVSCWGNNTNGQLGSGPGTPNLPRAVDVGGTATDLVAGVDVNCAIVGGAAKCWGFNHAGQLGRGTTGGNSATPAPVVGLASGVTDIHINNGHACAIRGGNASCWGVGANGTLGNGATANANTPVAVRGLTGVTAIVTGTSHSCAVAGGRNYCWGSNSHRQLGNEAAGSFSAVPVPVIGSRPVTPPPAATPRPPVVTPARATIRKLSGRRSVNRRRRATLATVACPPGPTCTITAPKTVKVTIKGKRFTVKVITTRTLAGGRRLTVGVRLSKAAAKRLRGRTAGISLRLTARAGFTTPTTLIVRATLKGAKKRR